MGQKEEEEEQTEWQRERSMCVTKVEGNAWSLTDYVKCHLAMTTVP